RDAIDDANDLSLERLRLVGPGVLEDPVADFLREVEAAPLALQRLDDAQRMLVVAEAVRSALTQHVVERLLTRVPERRMAEIVAEPDRLDEVLVQAESPRDAPCDPGRLECVREPGPEVIPLRVDEHLGLVAQPTERFRVGDPVAVALERRAQAALILHVRAAAALVRADGQGRQPALLVLAHEALEGVSNTTGQFRHPER